jgi:uncharacterized protein YidB (DUF937 family)
VVDPVSLSLGAVVAALVAKTAERAGERAADGAAVGLGRLVGWLRGRLSGAGAEPAAAALAGVEEVPDSPSRVKGLAAAIDQLAEAEPRFRDELRAWVRETREAGVDVESVSQSVWGNQNVQVAGVSDSDIAVTFGDPPKASGR